MPEEISEEFPMGFIIQRGRKRKEKERAEEQGGMNSIKYNYKNISTTFNFTSPFGVSTVTLCPLTAPTSALPTGLK